eukprot:gene3315-3636_t
MDDDVVRFMVSTDNHLGFAERDPVRGLDSFAAFEEVLLVAKQKKVDFVLFAGDLFHENKPSRRTIHIAMELLRQYCFGGDPIYIQILNDQGEIFKASFGKVNYEDPYQSISLPIFSIHGNHDDPSREGGAGEALAALDLLAVSNLLNYIGKVDRVDSVEVVPVLISKGNTKLALYGLGAMRDERLNRMWNQKKVKFVRLTEEQGRDDFFNIFVLHQNRDYGRGKKSCLHESMIPDWMDLVIWGNEHECLPNLSESVVGTYRILQPGSSVACSLSAGESSERPKHMVFFEVKERKFRSKPIRYQNVRQFIFDDIALRGIPGLEPNDPKVEEKMKEELAKKVVSMISEARRGILEPAATKYGIIDPQKVLVRLRVDHEGFPSLNHQRFGSQYLGDVANPAEILLLTKKRKEINRSNFETREAVKNELRQLIEEGAEEEVHRIKIEDLVNEALSGGKNALSILAESEMAQAMDDYIVKKVSTAIQDLVVDSLKRTQRILQNDRTVRDKESIAVAAGHAKQEVDKQPAKPAERSRKTSSSAVEWMEDNNEENMEVEEVVPVRRAKKAPTKGTATRGRKRKDAEEIEEASVQEISSTTRRSARSTKNKKTSKIDSSENEEDLEEENDEGSDAVDQIEIESNDDEVFDEEDEDSYSGAPRGRSSRAATRTKGGRAATAGEKVKASKTTKASASSSKQVASSPPSKVRARPKTAAIDLRSDIEEEEPRAETSRSRATRATPLAKTPAPATPLASSNPTREPVSLTSTTQATSTAGKRRQLPLSFSQAGGKPSKSSLAKSWDD